MTPVPCVNKNTTHLFSILLMIFLTMGASGLRHTSCPFLRVALQREGRVRVGGRWGWAAGLGHRGGGGGGHKDASSGSREGRHLHDFGLGAVGSRRRHLDILDVLEVNSLQGLQALAAQFGGHGRSCGENRPG